MKILIRNGVVCDPQNKFEKKADLLIENGKIRSIGKILPARARGVRTIDARNRMVVPGLIDIHCHLREPGREDEETIRTATRAAVKGGFTSICSMPNTQPVIDSVSGVKFVLETARQEGVVNVFPVGAITKGSLGQELASIGKMKQAGIIAISDDGHPVMNAVIMRRALEYCKMFDIPVISHCEDTNLSQNGEMNEGYISTVLGLKGIPRQAEEIMVARDIALAELTGGRLHIAHISTARSVDLVRHAKKSGIRVTAETAPHYFSLTEELVKASNYNTNTKINPPLRTKKDVEAIKRGLKDNSIDCIASDHAPHLAEEKDQEYKTAPFGIIGLETTLPLVITYLVNNGKLTLRDALMKLSVNPARILNLKKGNLSPGSDADVTILNLKETRTIERFESMSRNSPFLGMKLTGFADGTIVGGKVVMLNSKLLV
ncbi:MAG: dihydroorotase [bacterium]|nr:dihydroorotase [bacterium]